MERMRTLLVDNNNHVQKAMRSFLVTLAEIELVGCAASGEEALRKMAHLEPDLVVMDVGMPGMSAFEAARRMLEFDPALWIVMVALFDEFAYRAHAKRCGAVTVMSKMEVIDKLPKLLAQLAAGVDDDSTETRGAAAATRF